MLLNYLSYIRFFWCIFKYTPYAFMSYSWICSNTHDDKLVNFLTVRLLNMHENQICLLSWVETLIYKYICRCILYIVCVLLPGRHFQVQLDMCERASFFYFTLYQVNCGGAHQSCQNFVICKYQTQLTTHLSKMWVCVCVTRLMDR